jgi:hypothetical protein
MGAPHGRFAPQFSLPPMFLGTRRRADAIAARRHGSRRCQSERFLLRCGLASRFVPGPQLQVFVDLMEQLDVGVTLG